MPRQTTFIHAADLHLGAPFKGLRTASDTWAEKMLRAIPAAFRRVIDLALERQVDFVVFPGDLFDNSRPSYADFALFVEGMRRLQDAGIPAYFCMGNHDPYTSWQRDLPALPDNVHAFSSEGPSFFLFERGGEPLVLLGGRSYHNAAFPAEEDISAGISRNQAADALGVTAPFAVGVLHSGLDIDPTRSPVEPRELLRRGMDYWALGHIHQVRLMPEEHPSIAYSGCPQARAIHETGPHGCLLVTMTEGAPNEVEFHPLANVEWQRFELDVSACLTLSEVQEAITNKQFALNAASRCQDMIFRVTLVGRTPLHKELTPTVLEDMRSVVNDAYPFFFIDEVIDATQPSIDEEALRREGLFPAVFLSALEAAKGDRATLLSSLEHEFQELDLPLPLSCERHIDELCDEAHTLVLDLLGRGER